MSRAFCNKTLAVVMTTCATSHLDPPHDIAQLIFPRPSKEIELLQFRTTGSHTHTLDFIIFLYDTSEAGRGCLNSVKISLSVQHGIKVQIKSLKFRNGCEIRNKRKIKLGSSLKCRALTVQERSQRR